MSENNLQNFFIEAFGGMLTIGNVQQLINFLKLKTNDDNHIITNVVNISIDEEKSDGGFTKVEATKLIQGKLPRKNGNKLTIEIPVLDGSHFYNYRVEIEKYKKGGDNDEELSYKITGFEKIDTRNSSKEKEIDERVKNLIAEACGLQQNEILVENNNMEKYSNKVKQKQEDDTSCGWYAVAVLNDIINIIYNKGEENNLGIIGKNEHEGEKESNDEELRKKILERLTLQQIAELYNGYSIDNAGKCKGREDITLLCKILDKKNHPTFFDLNINQTNSITVINIGTDFYTIKDNTIYTIEKGENGYKLKEHEKDCNEDVIKYIKYCYNNLKDVKNMEFNDIKEIKNEKIKDFKEVKEIEINGFNLVEALILQIMEEEKEKENENDEDEEEEEEKNKEEKNTIKEKIKAIPLNLKIAFLKKLAEENNDDETKTWEKLRNTYNDDDNYTKVYPFIINMIENLDRNSLQRIFNVQKSDNFYTELKKQNDNYLFIGCFCKTKNSIEYLKYKLVNDFDDFTKKDKEDEEHDNNDHLENHQISIYDLKDLLKDKEFIEEFKEINKGKNFFDIWNAFKTCNAIKGNDNDEIEHIQLNCGEFFVEEASKETLLNNENIVITNAGNNTGQINGGGINGGCASVYGEYDNNVFGLEKGENYKENEQVRLIEKVSDNCCIIEIKKEGEDEQIKEEYTMVYLVGPNFKDASNNNTKSELINKLDKALNNYIDALNHKELKGKTIVFSGISNAIFAGNYKDYTKDQGGNKFNIMDFYNALYLKSKLKNTKLECNLFFINGVSNAMEYVESLQKNLNDEIDLYDLFKNGTNVLLNKDDPIFGKINELMKDLKIKINFTTKERQNSQTTVPVSIISNKDIKKAEEKIETQMKRKIESNEILRKFFEGKNSSADKKFNKLDIFNCATCEKNKNSVSEDTKKACQEIKKICEKIDNGDKTDTYIIADAVEKSETVDKAYEKVLKNDQYKENHNSMQCTYEKGEIKKKDKYKLKLEIVEGQCKGAKIEFDVPNDLNEMKVFVLIGLYGMNNVINVVSGGECNIEYNGSTYKSIEKLENNNDLKDKFEFQKKNEELKQQLINLTKATEEIGKSIEKKQGSPGQTKQ